MILSFFLIMMSVMEIFFLQSIFILVNFISGNNETIFNSFINQNEILNLFGDSFKTILILFFLLFLVKSLFNIFVIRYEANFLYRTREELSNSFFKRYTDLPKLFHIKLSLANLSKKIIIQVDDLTAAIRALSTLFLEFSILILITFYLLSLNFYLTIYIFCIFSLSAIIIIYLNKKKIIAIGLEQLDHNENRIKIVNEVLSSLKFFKSKKFKDNYTQKYFNHTKKTNDISIQITFKNNIIRPLFELIILLVIVTTLLFIFVNNLKLNDFLPLFAVFLAGCYRLMPSYARIMQSYQTYKFHVQPVSEYYSDTLNLFTKNHYPLSDKKFNFNKKIEFNKLSFSYEPDQSPNKKTILQDTNFIINKNSKICIIGNSGVGKSTLLDIIMGLSTPETGEIKIDDENMLLSNTHWQKKISFVPQNVFITSDSLKKNIALGFEDEEIDEKKVNFLLEFCNLKNFVNSLKDSVKTKLSDSGTNISGGQKQRIGIARALYSQPEVLILDEPTNNLDELNEKNIIDKLLSLKDITLIVTTHKRSLINKFDKIFEISDKKILEK